MIGRLWVQIVETVSLQKAGGRLCTINDPPPILAKREPCAPGIALIDLGQPNDAMVVQYTHKNVAAHKITPNHTNVPILALKIPLAVIWHLFIV